MTMKIYTLDNANQWDNVIFKSLDMYSHSSYRLIKNEYDKFWRDLDEEIKLSLKDNERVSASVERWKS